MQPGDPLAVEVMKLRGRAGATPTKLVAKCPLLLSLLGVSDPDRAFELLRETLQDMGAGKEATALLNALNLGGPGEGELLLHERRIKLAASYGGVSTETVENWENVAIRELALRLRTGIAGEQSQAQGLPRPAFLLRDRKVVALISDESAQFLQETRLVALQPGVSQFAYGNIEQTRLAELRGVKLGRIQRTSRGVVFPLKFGRSLAVGEEHSFSFRETVIWNYRDDPEAFVGQTFHQPALRFQVCIVFLGTRPKRLWWFEQMHPILRPGKPKAAQELRLKGKEVARTFSDLYGGLSSGIAWRY